MSPLMKLSAITLDCAEPRVLAAFYQEVTGLEPHPRSDDDFASLRSGDGDGPIIGFQRVDGHRPPTWPEPAVPQQLHLCFDVADLDAAEARLLALGAGKPEWQPDEGRWRVLTDPAGHPFCIVVG
ncbi:VOC family protein [Streptomyces sp. NPDC048659]|uniref:VOC family protein n=1 Tax=Streptomyces sp. NPDC048659 TaxID=3155489 RepID=UPI0034146FB0